MDSESELDECNLLESTPPHISERAKIADNAILPVKSKGLYVAAYDNFVEWKQKNKTNSFSESVLMAYFLELSSKYQPSTLWSKYSMLKTMLKTKNDIDIKSYTKLSAFLKRKSEGFRCKKSNVLTAENIEKFINEAPDDCYLATKVALIFGVCGACRRQELANITVKDIETHGNMYLIHIPNTKNKIPRSFTVDGTFFDIVKKYIFQRTSKGKSDRFFSELSKRKMYGSSNRFEYGLNKFGNMPKEIARFLQLLDADSYTGHSFRRTSATLLADSGADIMTLKRHGGWRANNVAEGYVEDSIGNKIKIGNQITQSIHLKSSPKHTLPSNKPQPSTSYEQEHQSIFLKSSPKHILPFNEPQPCTSYVQEHQEPEHEPPLEPSQSYEINNSSSVKQTIKLPSKAFNITLNNSTNCTVNYYLTKE